MTFRTRVRLKDARIRIRFGDGRISLERVYLEGRHLTFTATWAGCALSIEVWFSPHGPVLKVNPSRWNLLVNDHVYLDIPERMR